jgi:hypothetical protein
MATHQQDAQESNSMKDMNNNASIDSSLYYDNHTYKRKSYIAYLFFINKFFSLGNRIFLIFIDSMSRRITKLISNKIIKA